MGVKDNTKLYDIHCPSCGAPAYFDIKHQIYTCRYCDGKVRIDKALREHQGFREIQKKKMQKDIHSFALQKSVCTGCGAEVVFDKGDAIANCVFCGRSLVRKAFVNADSIPELIIPFAIMPEEARDLLTKWCEENSRKKEAKAIRKKVGELTGCYLPYELVRGPVDCRVYRIENGGFYDGGGFVDKTFVNCSKNLDNRLLDGMEPFDLDEITEFDFAYVAGHQVKVGDISGDELARRIDVEIRDDYIPVIQKTLEAKAVGVSVDSKNVLRKPVLLPVYYLAFDGFMTAVNGQTGKVSVLAQKESHYIILPWWLKAILWTLIGTGVTALGMLLLGAESDLIKVASVYLGVFLFIVLMVAYADTRDHECWVEAAKKVFTSKGGRFVRDDGKLIQTQKVPEATVSKPVFFMNINGKREVVELKFTSLPRVLKTISITLLIMFLPVVLALFINGFHFSMINLGGSAPWFCITVPLAPVLLVKYGRISLYDDPWIYIIDDSGRKKRHKEKFDWGFTRKDVLRTLPVLLFKPPACFLTWFCIMTFCAMVYLTAFGDW